MASSPRPAIALAQPQGVSLGPRLRRLALVALAGAALAGIAYGVARTTSLFALRSIEVSGAPAAVERQVEAALEPFRGRSLVGLDTGAVEHAVEAIPMVRSASLDREFPRTLHVTLRTEQPVAVVRRGEGAWLVAASGKVLESIRPGTVPRLPRVWLPQAGAAVEPAKALPLGEGGVAAAALAQVPPGFPEPVRSAHGTAGDLTFVLGGHADLRLGEAVDVRLKLAAAATVLRTLSSRERARLAYLDVSLPARPVAALKSQVET